MTQKTTVKFLNDACETSCFNGEVVSRVQPKIDEVTGVELLFKALSDATRLKIVYALTLEEELCVCDVAQIIGSTTATASHHLRLLRNMGLAKYRKEGKMVYYSVKDDHVHQLVSIALEHSRED
ncbi:metalloregulator ArsR/SmtB family transcription factor [Domibacillus sp. DTU_2020_1001157_1_SI_ALB_TIR_016]|uniref:ArsR/SmtB family transcription factor n=1 Tax=Domibacillus sp. DTU_2020_1001157_1_SI_ALB_TIR_016 TaxID=3077789 RepID=UPI0028E3AFB9|nr:metalloregulator ArsR/SmtB family transcription factor [Domibacillus sp. DTU_2020_1001157_1_SI_ALB_TIR_016]WNS80662.1 metalloregulator ArsR/SmtB family transcription factor [Domibacillus sp. DTU_2020_1001157_1_SI_ALB_TIR_016]